MQVHRTVPVQPGQVPFPAPPQVPPLPPPSLPPVALGNRTKSAAASDEVSSRRRERFSLQSAARAVLPDHRVGCCLRSPLPEQSAVDVCYVPDRGTAHYGGLQVCGSVWVCPVCAAKVSERRREELQTAIERHRASGGIVLIAAFTFSHSAHFPLSQGLERFLAAFRSMTGSRAYRRLAASYGVVGTVKALEVTWGEANGWHPHCHVLFFLDGSCEVDLGAFRSELFMAWEAAAARQQLGMSDRHGLVVQSTWGAVFDYVQKWGKLPERRLWEAADELTKAHTKRAFGERFTPFDLLRWIRDTGELQPVRLFREFAAAFKGRRQLVWSPGLRALLGLGEERSDEEIALEQEAAAVVLGRLTLNEWRWVCALDLRAQVLEAASSGDWGCVLAVVGGRPAPGVEVVT